MHEFMDYDKDNYLSNNENNENMYDSEEGE